MIVLVNGEQRDRYTRLMDSVFRLRAEVFKNRLGWDVVVTDGREIDRFDDLDPLYLVSVDDMTGRVVGTLRLLPTTGPNMLRDVFPELLPDGLVVESATIWESSRFCVDPAVAGPGAQTGLRSVTGELLAGAIDVGLRAGLGHIVSVFDARMLRILRQAGCPAEVIGEPRQIGVCRTYAGLFEVSESVLANIWSTFGFTHSVLDPQTIRVLDPQATRRCFAA